MKMKSPPARPSSRWEDNNKIILASVHGRNGLGGCHAGHGNCSATVLRAFLPERTFLDCPRGSRVRMRFAVTDDALSVFCPVGQPRDAVALKGG
jgi:hypothetical protein